MKEAHEKPAGAESPSRARGKRVSRKAARKKGARVLRKLSEDEMNELLERLKFFAKRRYHPPLHSEDLVMEAIRAVLEHRRSWNSKYSPFHNLCWIVIGIASNELEKEKRAVPLDTSDDGRPTNTDPALTSTPDSQSPDTQYEAAERLQINRELLSDATAGDSDSGRIVEDALDLDGWKPRKIAADLDMPVSEVQNAKKRLRRKLNWLRDRDRNK